MATATLPQLPGHNQYLVGRLPSAKEPDKRSRLTDQSLPAAKRGQHGLVANEQEPRNVRPASGRKARSGPKAPHRLPKLQTLVNGKYDQDGQRIRRPQQTGSPSYSSNKSSEGTKSASLSPEERTDQATTEASPQRHGDSPDESSRPEVKQQRLKTPESKHPQGPKAEERPKTKPNWFHAKERNYSAGRFNKAADKFDQAADKFNQAIERFNQGPGTVLPRQIKPSLPPEARRPPPHKQNDDTSQIPPGPRRIFHAPTLIVNEKKTHLYPPRHAIKVPLVPRRKPDPPNRERKPGRSYDKPWLARASTHGALPPRRERVRTAARMKRAGTQFSRIYNNKDKTNDWLRTGLSRPDLKGLQAREKSLAVYTDPARKIPPWHRKEYVLSRNEADMYNHINHTYGNGDIKKARVKRFYNKVEEVQLDNWRKTWDKEMDRKREGAKTKRKQQHQLKHVRDKFEEDRYKRYMSQYVTTRVLDYEWATRHVYGLPEDINEDPQQKVKIKRRKAKAAQTFDTDAQYKKNRKKYDVLFNMHHGPDWDRYMKRPKMAGIDTVELDDGKGKQVDVKYVVGDAQKMLESGSEDDDDLSIDVGSDSDGEPRRRRTKGKNDNASKSPERKTLSPKKIYMRPPSPVQNRSQPPIKQKVFAKRPPTNRPNAGKRANVPTKFGAKVNETQKGQYHIKRKGPKNRDGWVPRAETVNLYTEVEPGKKPSRRYKDYVQLKDADNGASDEESGSPKKAQYVSASSDLYGKGYDPNRPNDAPKRTKSKEGDQGNNNEGGKDKNPKVRPDKNTTKGNLKKETTPKANDPSKDSKLKDDPSSKKNQGRKGAGPDASKTKPSDGGDKSTVVSIPTGNKDNSSIPGSKSGSRDGKTLSPEKSSNDKPSVKDKGNGVLGNTEQNTDASKSEGGAQSASSKRSKRPLDDQATTNASQLGSSYDSGKDGKSSPKQNNEGEVEGDNDKDKAKSSKQNNEGEVGGDNDKDKAKSSKQNNNEGEVGGDNDKDKAKSSKQNNEGEVGDDNDKDKAKSSKQNNNEGEVGGDNDNDKSGKASPPDAANRKSSADERKSRRSRPSSTTSKKDGNVGVSSNSENDTHGSNRDQNSENDPNGSNRDANSENDTKGNRKDPDSDKYTDGSDGSKRDISDDLTNKTKGSRKSLRSKASRGASGSANKAGQDEETNDNSGNSGKDDTKSKQSAENLEQESNPDKNTSSNSEKDKDKSTDENSNETGNRFNKKSAKSGLSGRDNDGEESGSKVNGNDKSSDTRNTRTPSKSAKKNLTPPPSRKGGKEKSKDSERQKVQESLGNQQKSRKSTPSTKNKDDKSKDASSKDKDNSNKDQRKDKKENEDRNKKKKPKTPLENLRLPPSPAPPKPDPYRRDVPSADLESDSDDDIFERARKKYGIVLDSDDDD